MKERMKILAIIPLWGTIILLTQLNSMSAKREINRKNYRKAKLLILLIGLDIYCFFSRLFLLLYVLLFNWADHHIHLLMELMFISGGYVLNAFAFIYLNKKWRWLHEPLDSIR